MLSLLSQVYLNIFFFSEVLQHCLFMRKGGGHLVQTWIFFFSCVFLPSVPESEQGLTLQSPTQRSDGDREPAHMKKLFHFKGTVSS